MTRLSLFHLCGSLPGWTASHKIADARAAARNVLANPQTNAPYGNEPAGNARRESWGNGLLGGPIHEEDSPGNYTIREADGRLEFVIYDAQGAEHAERFGY